MLWCLLGFIVGAAVVALGALTLQYVIIRAVLPALGYRFDKYVFYTRKFPVGDFEQGRVVRRCLYPARVTIRFFDAQFNEAIEAQKPGRYGAVVRMHFIWGFEMYRFITLYRTPEKVFWYNGSMTVSAQLPPDTGVDPAVMARQSRQIGEMVKIGFAGEGEVSSHLSILLAGLSETSPDEPPAAVRSSTVARNTKWWFDLRKRIGLEQKYPYLTDFPPGYDKDPNKRWPLIIYLHGGNQNGYNMDLVRISGLAGVIAKEWRPPAVVVSPQAPWYEDWNIHVLAGLIEEACAKYRIDPDQISLTGMSSGAVATWEFAMTYQDRLSAIFPIAGDSDPLEAPRLTKIPVWAFTGIQDTVIPAGNVIRMVEAIRAAGGKPHLTVYQNRGHNAEYLSYINKDLYTWLFSQRRGQAEVFTPGLPES
jgi:acetyl esterase/lipase